MAQFLDMSIDIAAVRVFIHAPNFIQQFLPRKNLPRLIQKLKVMFPGCIVLKNDANYIQGFPDLTVLWKERWALLECKRTSEAHKQPNQQYYIDRGNELSFARFISPENEEEVLYDLQQAFGA